MNKETIQHNNKKVIKTTKQNGEISYSIKGVYIGTDIKTGKRITKTITAKTLKALDRKIVESKIQFEKSGSTIKETIQIDNFENLAEVWFSNFKTWVSSQNTINRVRGYLDTYIIPQFGGYKPDQIEPADVQFWVNKLARRAKKSVDSGVKRAKKGSAKDFGAMAHKVSDIFDFGITNFGLTTNPAKSIKIPPKPKANKERIMVLHDEDLKHWLSYLETLENTRANRRFKVICNTLLASALRINELLALEITDLNFETNEILVSKTLMWKSANKKLGIKGEMICKKTPKTDSGNRRIAVPPSIMENLKEFHEEMTSYFDNHGLPKSSLIFPTIYGNYMCDRNERATLKKRLSALGLPDYGFHLFRHTHASMMLNSGMNWKELQHRMGHKSITTTMDTYAELAPKKKFEAVDIFLNKMEELAS
ncbi:MULTISPECIES: tyrosine-type recombinase/integrase [Streptococcus]|uniref:Phage integrase family domain protein n=1 Tax=Streptococcus gordonii (strain Challis / ATCC 35105 / BCRC 15272 / CH1 / DL1 / V288) TaxID=467705 RepID=A8AZW4_STRGC|nr:MULTISPECIES: site-specific integrase [Streptococcus]ABV10109.1 Phage integrase family domain protein [Streptococcus gordonii str. Challis substr. CH1]MBZ2138564.1 site-specific integrase [Streptococcus gordonii]QGS44340.1 tyrosine-type recombinase/integrase [Streptococcus gordonii]VEE23255.1 phage integrase family protein [Streptococcus gordonii]